MITHEPSGCGILGVLRKRSAGKIRGSEVLKAIERVRYRGSDKGAGYAVFNIDPDLGGNGYRVKIFIDNRKAGIEDIIETLKSQGFEIKIGRIENLRGPINSCELLIRASNSAKLMRTIRKLNQALWGQRLGRIYSSGRSLDVFKGVGFPIDVASIYNIENIEGDMWLAHTRQPTNSPGHYPYWSHPFATTDLAVVHNGDLSSFGANMEFLSSRGWGGFVGTDSEVIAMIFEELLSDGLEIEDAIRIMIGLSRETTTPDPRIGYIYRNARLDGPFSAIIGYNSGNDLYMIVIADRFKLRPIVLGEDDERIYAASEENEIRELSPRARVWTLKPGEYFIASLKRGVIRYGRPLEEINTFSPPPVFEPRGGFDIDARYMGYRELNREIAEKALRKRVVRVANVMGHRYIGMNLPRLGIEGVRIELYGVAGNCLANLNRSNIFYVYGNVSDDCGDTMHGGKIVITGDARDVLAQALQGGKIFVGGNAGNRVGVQMREYRDRRPYLVIGGRVDNYLGEYMAGGVIFVLNTRGLSEPTGSYVGSGMVGGRIYIRGKVSPSRIGLQPPRTEIIRFLRAMVIGGYIDEHLVEELSGLDYIELINRLPEDATKFAKKLYEERIGMPMYEYRELSEEEIKELLPVLREYSEDLGSDHVEYIGDKYTVIKPRR
jgi:glutamate synthase domain-containing protein 1/glutamate synthase domain-containing protein 3